MHCWLVLLALVLACSEPFDPCREVPLSLGDMGVRDPEVDFEYDLECGRLRAVGVGEPPRLPGAGEACARVLVESFGSRAVEGSALEPVTPEEHALHEAAARYGEAYNRLLAGELPGESRAACEDGASQPQLPGIQEE